ncbi:MAG: FecCD family ABC transporter permease [Clostridia bacterium]
MNKKYISYYLIAAMVLLGAIALALCTGSVKMNIRDLVEGFTRKDEALYIILTKIRLPRVLGASLAGWALAVAGCVLQAVTNNPLCAPNIIGVNSGAGFAVILTLCLFPSLWMIVPLAAFVGALLSTGVVMGVSFAGGRKTSTGTIVLSGVAVSSILSGGISFLSLRYPDVLTSYTAFSVGGFSDVALKDILLPFVIVLLSTVVLQIMAAKINLLCLGDEIAKNLGVNVKRVRIISIIFSAALCAAAVSFAGLLGFVGLIVPNAVRKICGNDNRYNILFSALAGAIIVIFSDWAGRFFFAPTELPAGIIMSFLGAPFFLYLLLKGRLSHD